MGSLWRFARRSSFAMAFAAGVVVLVASALVGTSMLSMGHVAGAALAVFGLAGLAWRDALDAISWRPSRAVFIAVFVVVAVAWCVQGWAHYWSGTLHRFDAGIFADIVANIALHGEFRSSLLGADGMHAFADHFTPSLALLAPLFKLAPTVVWLLVAKYLAALGSALALYFIGREVLGRQSRWLWAAPCLCLVHTIFGFAYNFQFQPNQLAPPLALLGFWLALKERWLALALCLVVLFGLKEDQALVGVCIGVFLVVERRRPRLGVALMAVSVVVAAVIFAVVMPMFAEGATVLQHTRFAPFASIEKKAFLVVVLFASVGFVPLIHPRSLWWILPALGAHFLSGFENMFGFRYHYQAVPVAILMVGVIYGLAAVERGSGLWLRLGRWRRYGAAGALALVLALNGMLPHFSARLAWPSAEYRAIVAEVLALRASLPSDRRVYASDDLVSYLVPHQHLRSFRLKYGARPRDERAGATALEYGVDVTKPHVIVLATRGLRALENEPYPLPLVAMRSIAEAYGYRSEAISPHLLLFTSAP